MLISIFPTAKALPKTKGEKTTESFKCSNPNYPAVKEVLNEDDLIYVITHHAWSPNLFNGYRLQNNFVQTDMMVLDIDSGMRIEEAETMVNNMGITALCMPSTSHSEEAHRFRLIFPLSRTVKSKEDYSATMSYLAELFPADPSCVHDYARYYFGCRDDAGFWTESSLLEPIIAPKKPKEGSITTHGGGEAIEVGETLEELVTALYGEKRTKVPEYIHYFLENAHTGLPGEWYHCANRFVFVASLVGCDYERISEVYATVAPDELDSKDIQIIDTAYSDGQDKRIEEFAKEDL